ncbi:hypothetical protein I310_04842 [Cryptococcus deuterogattii CA1014]|nr:hypothetical protein I310_04842 [Cryptococcus deuterogattii CA1014]
MKPWFSVMAVFLASLPLPSSLVILFPFTLVTGFPLIVEFSPFPPPLFESTKPCSLVNRCLLARRTL